MTESVFVKELEYLINKHSKENDSNTPDFLLASYLDNCLKIFGQVVRARDSWYGVDLKPGRGYGGPVQAD